MVVWYEKFLTLFLLIILQKVYLVLEFRCNRLTLKLSYIPRKASCNRTISGKCAYVPRAPTPPSLFFTLLIPALMDDSSDSDTPETGDSDCGWLLLSPTAFRTRLTGEAMLTEFCDLDSRGFFETGEPAAGAGTSASLTAEVGTYGALDGGRSERQAADMQRIRAMKTSSNCATTSNCVRSIITVSTNIFIFKLRSPCMRIFTFYRKGWEFKIIVCESESRLKASEELKGTHANATTSYLKE